MVIKCPECNHYVSDMTKICPHCGFILKADAEPLVEPKPVVHTEEIETAISSVEIAAMEPQVEAAHIMEKPAEPTMVEKPEAPTMPKKPVEPSMVEKPAEIVKEKKTAEPQVERTMEEGGKSPKQIQCPPTPKASPTISTPVAPPPIAYQQAEKSNTALYAVIAVLALLICGVGYYLFSNRTSNGQNSLQQVERMYFESDLGVCSYSGTVDSNQLPHGRGEAVFTDNRFYRGDFVHGSFESRNAFFRYENGDVFEGTFSDNKFSNGRYTINSDGSYFVGTFKNGQPDEGQWYDKGNNPI